MNQVDGNFYPEHLRIFGRDEEEESGEEGKRAKSSNVHKGTT